MKGAAVGALFYPEVIHPATGGLPEVWDANPGPAALEAVADVEAAGDGHHGPTRHGLYGVRLHKVDPEVGVGR